ncbi:zinc knuckle CX2CX4HX4C containing protein [Tanacetum coccineum]
MVKMVPYEAFACPCGAGDVVLRESYKPKTRGKLYYACPRSKEKNHEEQVRLLVGSPGASTTLIYSPGSSSTPIYSPGSSTPPRYSPGASTPQSYSPGTLRNVECSNCKHLLDKITFETTLYDYFIGKRIAFPVVEYYVRNNWANYGLTRLMMNFKGFFFFKFESNKGLEDVRENGPWMIHNSSIILKKWTMNTSLFKEELTRILLWVKLHDVPLQVFLDDGISLIASQIVKVDKVLKDNITMGIPLPEFPAVDMNNDGFQTMVNKRKSGKTSYININRSGDNVGKAALQPIKPKFRFEPKAHDNSPKNGAPNVVATRKGVLKASTSLSNIFTSNSYDLLPQEFDPENYTRSGDEPNSAQDDMESGEEVEVVLMKLLIPIVH